MEKRTCCTGQRPDRGQVLLMIRTRYDNLQRQRNKGGGRRDAGHAFNADAGSSGKTGGQSTPRGARNRGGWGRGGRGGRGRNGREKGGEKKMVKRPTSKPGTETSTAVKGATQGTAAVASSATNWCDAPGRCVVFAAKRAIRRKYAPTSSPSSPAKLPRVAATVTGFSAEKSRMPSSAMHQASFSTSLVNGVHMRLAWQMGDLPGICDNGASCHMSHSSTRYD